MLAGFLRPVASLTVVRSSYLAHQARHSAPSTYAPTGPRLNEHVPLSYLFESGQIPHLLGKPMIFVSARAVPHFKQHGSEVVSAVRVP